MRISLVTLVPKWRFRFAPPDSPTYSSSSARRTARRSVNTSMKLDLPAPLAPINTLIGPSGSRSSRAMLLKPSTVIQSICASRPLCMSRPPFVPNP